MRSPYLLTGLVLITLFLPGCYTKHKKAIEEQESVISEKQALISNLEAKSKHNEALIKELQDKIGTLEDSRSILLKQAEDNMVITIPDDILFSSGATLLNKRGITVLKTLGEVLENYSDRPICIEGHTNNLPIAHGARDDYHTKRELSVARSIQVMNYLAGHFQIQQNLISVKGYGPYKPVASNDTLEGMAENRCFVIVLGSSNN